MTDKDSIYSQPIQKIADFNFDDNVAKVFGDMINRSVPGYETIVGMSGILASKFAKPGTACYDLGCSLGGTTFAMRQHIDKGCKIVAVDNSPAMITRLQEIFTNLPVNEVEVTIQQADITEVEIANASVVALNFTLQFIPPEQRCDLLQRIYHALMPGGILILSEKLHFEDPQLNQLFIQLHHEFKRENGYSHLEISQKRTALENVLIPESLDNHKSRLAKAGFTSIDVWFQCFNFASMVAIK